MTDRFRERQSHYRAALGAFFDPAPGDDERARAEKRRRVERLRRLVASRADGGYDTLLHFFSDHYSHIARVGEGTARLHQVYRATLAEYKQRYFDLKSAEGSGDLVWEGRRNPPVPLQCGVSSEPLPVLVFMHWLIRRNFDELFWENHDEVRAHREAFIAGRNRRYTENHKAKNKRARADIEAEIVQKRTSPTNKKVRFNHHERREIAALLKERQRQERERRKLEPRPPPGPRKSGAMILRP